MRVSAARICRRIAGKLGSGGGPALVAPARFFPPEPQMLQEREGELTQQRMMVQATPGAALKMVEAEFFLHLLVHLLAEPSMAEPSICLRRSGRPQAAEGVI